MQIGGNAMPATMINRGEYLFQPVPITAINGRGVAIASGFATLDWKFDWLTNAEWTYWNTTVLTNLPSKAFASSIQLYNDNKVLTAYSRCVVYRPAYRTFQNGVYMSVQVRIGLIEA